MTDQEKIKRLIRDYLREAKMIQLATSVNDQPWVCHVWFAADEDLNIYWLSSITRRHSREVSKNKKTAAAIVLPQTPADPPRGLQLQGIAEMLTNKKDIDKALSVYKDRIFSAEDIKRFMEDKKTPHKFYNATRFKKRRDVIASDYKITPTQFVLFDLVNFPGNPRQEFNL